MINRLVLRAAATGALALATTPRTLAAEYDWLREIIVTAPRMQAPLVIEMDAKAPRQPLPANDGADHLKSVPGFSVARKGGTDGDPLFRGMAGSRVNVLLDGEQILGGCGMRMDPPTAYVFPEVYDRIVIVKGPQSVLHGPGASAATVRFERDPPQFSSAGYEVHTSALTATAGRRDLLLDAVVGGPLVYGRLAATHAQADDYEDGADRNVHSSYSRWNINGALGGTPDERTRIELSGARSDGEAAYADRMMDGVQFDRVNVGLRFERTALSERVRKLEAQAFYNDVDHVMDNYSLRAFTPSMMMPGRAVSNPDRRTVGGRVAVDVQLAASLTATLGGDAQRNEHAVRSTANQSVAPYQAMPRIEDAQFTQLGAFAETVWDVQERRRLIAGLRFDRWEAQDRRERVSLGMGMSGVNPTAGARRDEVLSSGFVRWEQDLVATPATWYVGVGSVERFPDYWESVAADRESTTSLSAFDTRAEQTTQLDVGALLRTQRLHASWSLFYNEVDDYILLQSNYAKGMRNTTVVRNIDAATYGAEADVAWALTQSWRLIGALAYTRGRNESDGRPLAQLPPLETRVGLEYDDRVWSFGVLARAVADQERYAVNQGNIVGQDLGRTDGFATLALHGGWRGAGLTVSAGVDNVLDRDYAEHLSRGGAMMTGYVRTTRVNEPGRTAWLRLAAEFH